MHRRILKFIPTMAIAIVVIFGTGALHAQTTNAWGYSTGYGNVYGTFGLAQTMQTMYNTTRRHTPSASSSSSSTKLTTTSNARVAAAPPRVVRNHGVFRPDAAGDTGKAFSAALCE